MKKYISIAAFALMGLFVAIFLFFTGRLVLANLAIERERRSGPIQDFTLRTTSKLEIIPLYEEASSNAGLISGHGVSYLLRTNSATILMDVGDNPDGLSLPPFARNMQALGISAEEIDAIVISHPHPDHVGGVTAWNAKTVSLGLTSSDFAGIPIYVPSVAWQSNNSSAVNSRGPVQLSPDSATIGVISYPEVFPLSLYEPKGIEQALVVNVAGEGLVLITGCGHPGLERLFGRVEFMYDLPVVGVVGGLHYEGASAEQVEPQIRFLQPHQPKLVALSAHDSGPAALAAFQSAFGDRYRTLHGGEAIQFP